MVDELDRRIIMLLQEDGRASNTDLSRKLGVSESTVRRRVGQLVRSHIIRVTAIPKPKALGFEAEAFIGLEIQMGSGDSVAQHLAEMPEVLYIGSCTGRFDMFIWVVFPSQEELSDFLRSRLPSVDGIRRSETFVNLTTHKRTFGWLYETPKKK